MSTTSVAMNYDEGYAQGYADAMYKAKQWLIAQEIVREQMFGIPGLVAINCNTLEVMDIPEIGEHKNEVTR